MSVTSVRRATRTTTTTASVSKCRSCTTGARPPRWSSASEEDVMRLSGYVVVPGLVAVLAAVSGCSRSAVDRREPATPLAGTPGGSSTSRDALIQTITTMRARVAREPGDVRAAVQFADALIRQTRVTGNGGLANDAEHVLGVALARQ